MNQEQATVVFGMAAAAAADESSSTKERMLSAWLLTALAHRQDLLSMLKSIAQHPLLTTETWYNITELIERLENPDERDD